MQRLALHGRQFVVKRIAHQHVREQPAAGIAAFIGQAGGAASHECGYGYAVDVAARRGFRGV